MVLDPSELDGKTILMKHTYSTHFDHSREMIWCWFEAFLVGFHHTRRCLAGSEGSGALQTSIMTCLARNVHGCNSVTNVLGVTNSYTRGNACLILQPAQDPMARESHRREPITLILLKKHYQTTFEMLILNFYRWVHLSSLIRASLFNIQH